MGESRDGKLYLPAGQRFADYLRTLTGPVEVIIRKHRPARSADANSYYWGVVVGLLAEHLGYEPTELHVALRNKFLPERSGSNGKVKSVSTTAELNTAEFADYVDRCVRLAAECGCYVPDPERADW